MASGVEVWLFDPAALTDTAVRTAATSVLDAAEHDRAARFHFARDRDLYIAAHALTRTLLGRWTGRDPRDIRFRTGAYGKPVLDGSGAAPRPHFNLSHTRGLAALAVTWDHELGVDVEEHRAAPLELIDTHFAAPEAAAIRALAPTARDDAFFAVWTMKEAYIKAIGLGLSMPLDRFAVAWDPPGLLPFGDVTDGRAWHFVRLAPTRTTRLAVCAWRGEGDAPEIRVAWLPPGEIGGMHRA